MASIDGRSIGFDFEHPKRSIGCWRSVEYCTVGSTVRTHTYARSCGAWQRHRCRLADEGRRCRREACLQRDGRASAAQHGHDELREALRRERSAQRGQLVQHTPKRPHVRLVVVRPREAELGAHVQRRADDRVRELARLHQSATQRGGMTRARAPVYPGAVRGGRLGEKRTPWSTLG